MTDSEAKPTIKKLEVSQLANLKIAHASHSVYYACDELTVVGGQTSGFVPTTTAEYYMDGNVIVR